MNVGLKNPVMNTERALQILSRGIWGTGWDAYWSARQCDNAVAYLREKYPDYGTPNWCSTCTPKGRGYCGCEIASNE